MTKEDLMKRFESMQKSAHARAEQIRQESYNKRFSMIRESSKTLSDEEIHQIMKK